MSMHFDDRWFNYHDLNDDLEPEDLIGFIHQEMREAELRQRLGFPEEPEPEQPSPKAKSPRKRGCYQPIPQLVAWLANFFPEFTSRSLLANDFREIAQRLAWRCDIQCRLDAFNGSHSAVNLENGVFDLEANQLLEHNPHFRFNYQVHANYLTEPARVHCPVFEEFCNSSLDGDPDKRQLILEMIGYICSDLTAGKCAFFLKGQPNSVKSVISEFICRLFDSALISNVPLHQLGNRFARAELAGKKVNVAGEIAGRTLKDISIFKSITGSDRIMGEFKGKDPFYFRPSCKLLFAGNTLPRTTEADTTAAFVNRLKVLLFNRSIPLEQQDKHLLDSLLSEADSIVTLSLHALQRLMERNFAFTFPHDSKAFLVSFANRSNILAGFLEECCNLAPKARVFNADLLAAFADYCARNGLEPLPRGQFYDLLSGIPGVYAKRIRIGGENRQGHTGISLKWPKCSGTVEQSPISLEDQGAACSGEI